MRAKHVAVVMLASVGLVVSACGLDVVGIPLDNPTPDGAPPPPPPGATPPRNEDGATPPPVPITQPDGASCDCATPLPAGWTRVGLDVTNAAACPAGYDSLDVLENPVPLATACSCTTAAPCTLTASPRCDVGAIPCFIDQGGMCNVPGTTTANVPGGECDDYGGLVSISPHLRLTPPPASGGTCATTPVADKTKVTSLNERVCAPTAGACEATLCGTAGLTECVTQVGDVACPAGTPFVNRHFVGTDVTLSCPSTCTCSVAATCSGTLTIYSNATCINNPVTLVADDVCHATVVPVGGPGFRYYKYAAAVVPGSYACTGGGTSTGTATPSAATAHTVCCK